MKDREMGKMHPLTDKIIEFSKGSFNPFNEPGFDWAIRQWLEEKAKELCNLSSLMFPSEKVNAILGLKQEKEEKVYSPDVETLDKDLKKMVDTLDGLKTPPEWCNCSKPEYWNGEETNFCAFCGSKKPTPRPPKVKERTLAEKLERLYLDNIANHKVWNLVADYVTAHFEDEGKQNG